MSRFDYTKFDVVSQQEQTAAKELVTQLEERINRLPQGRAQNLAMTKLEECYMWIGKAIKDSQIMSEKNRDDFLS